MDIGSSPPAVGSFGPASHPAPSAEAGNRSRRREGDSEDSASSSKGVMRVESLPDQESGDHKLNPRALNAACGPPVG